jgi:Mg2+/Co2+ transporter CorC
VFEVIGIITLEDVLEQLLQEQIEDEIDFVNKRDASDMGKLLQVAMAKVANFQKVGEWRNRNIWRQFIIN